MLAVPPALLDILHLQPGAKVGIAVENGRLVVTAAAAAPVYTERAARPMRSQGAARQGRARMAR
jgi:antitoxin component of MazEF toxin-antitoxin module